MPSDERCACGHGDFYHDERTEETGFIDRVCRFLWCDCQEYRETGTVVPKQQGRLV